MQSNLADKITQSYLQTTAGRSHQPTTAYYQKLAQHWQRRLGDWLPKQEKARCLDLACGCGEAIYLYEQLGYEAAGVDLCLAELEQVRPFVKGELANMDIITYLNKQPDASFDFVTALNVLEHLDKDTIAKVLSESHRVLKPNGHFIAMVPNGLSPFSGVTRYWDITHEQAFTPNNFRQLAILVGYNPKIDLKECGPTIHGLKSLVRVALWKLIKAFIKFWFLVETGSVKDQVYTMDMLVRLKK